MKVLGIVVEYNPFHNGHLYHIQKSKEIIQADYVIAVMSSSFVQRGEPAIMDKWERSRIAVDYGIDLVIELPFVYACQSADYFARGAIDLLHAIGVTDLCFGSEDGHIDTFVTIAKTINTQREHYDNLIKGYMKKGSRYPDACNLALKDILGQEIKTPNDLLGLSYVKEIIFNHYQITPHCFKRTNDYHDLKIQNIASATAIRQALFTSNEYQESIPYHYHFNDLYYLELFYPYIQYQILTSDQATLQSYHLVEEGLENSLIKNIQQSHNIEEFIQSLLSKRYTRPRIQRMLIHILMKDTKQEINNAMNIDYLRILAMSSKGQSYLHSIKKTCPYHIITNFSKHQHPALDIEMKATKLISLISKHQNDVIKKEYQSIPYIKK